MQHLLSLSHVIFNSHIRPYYTLQWWWPLPVILKHVWACTSSRCHARSCTNVYIYTPLPVSRIFGACSGLPRTIVSFCRKKFTQMSTLLTIPWFNCLGRAWSMNTHNTHTYLVQFPWFINEVQCTCSYWETFEIVLHYNKKKHIQHCNYCIPQNISTLRVLATLEMSPHTLDNSPNKPHGTW